MIDRAARDDLPQRSKEDPHIEPYVEVRKLSSEPSIREVTFPPSGRLVVHSHPSDTLYVIRSGEFHIEGEGVFQPGDVRWVRGGLTNGPEWAGPEGAVLLIVALNGPFGTTFAT